MNPQAGAVLFAMVVACASPGAPAPEEEALPTQDLAAPTWYADADGDGYGDPSRFQAVAEQPAGYVDNADDCDDAAADVHPGATEACNGADDDCNGLVDEGSADTDADGTVDCVDHEECDALDNDGDGAVDEDFADNDGDGVADCVDSEACDGADNDGDGIVDEGYDLDGDGYSPCAEPVDCDDADATVSPGAAEVEGDGRDNDCDVLVDEGSWAAGDLVLTELMINPWLVSDGWGEWIEVANLSGRTVYLDGLRLVSGDEVAVLAPDVPFALEPGAYAVLGRSLDQDANGGVPVDLVYEGVGLSNESDGVALVVDGVQLDALSWDDGATMPDPSGAAIMLDPWLTDGLANDDPAAWCAAPDAWGARTDRGSPGAENPYCPTLDHDGDGYSADQGDCDDTDVALSPLAVETWYDGIDQDCDGWDDFDADQDGWAAEDWGGMDCDDADAAVSPSAAEICDAKGVDEDCNGVSDDDDAGVTDAPAWWPDSDGDGFGDAAGSSVPACRQPAGYAADALDCDDSDAAVNPGAREVCGDGIDNDCDDSAGTCGPEGEISLGDMTRILGAEAGDHAYLPAAAGDVDGDGVDDLWVGAPYANDGAVDVGAVFLVSGIPEDDWDLSDAPTVLWGASASESASRVAGDFDANGDGLVDVLVGAPNSSAGATWGGIAYLVLGPMSGDVDLGSANASFVGAGTNEKAGTAVAVPGDMDGDRLDELAIGAPGERSSGYAAGAVYLLSGVTSGSVSLKSAEAVLLGEAANDQAGYALAAAGDVDADGVEDLLVGAPYEGSAYSLGGAAYLVLGPVSGTSSLRDAAAKFQAEGREDAAGRSVAAAGDVDGDGYGDVLVGACQNGTSNDGAAYLLLGPQWGVVELARADAILRGEASGDEAGFTVAGPGDLNGDDYDDVAIGANLADGDATDDGAVYVAYGPLHGTLSLADVEGRLGGENASDSAGSGLAGGADLDADGYPDLVVGAPDQVSGGVAAGALYIVPGGPGL